jgi:ATP-binding cassette subfamily B protein
MTEHEAQLRDALRPSEELLLLTETDVERTGHFGRRWLAVTSERVMTFAEGKLDGGPEVEVRLDALRSVDTEHLVGQSSLRAETDGRRVELVRFSNSLSDRFSKVAKGLNDACKKEKRPEFDLHEEELRHCPECGRLLPEKGSFCPACLKKWEVLRRFWRYVRPYWPKALVVTLCMFISPVLALVPPYLTKVMVDDVFKGQGGLHLLGLVVLALAGAYAINAGINIVQGRLSAWVSSGIVHEVRFEVYQAIQRLSLRRHDKTQTGGLLARLTHDTTMLNFIIIEGFSWFFPMTLQLVGICIMLFVLCWWLALLVLIPVPLVMGLAWWFYRQLSRVYGRWWQTRSKMSAMAGDAISGIRVVKAFSQEPREVDRFGRKSREVFTTTAAAEGTWATAWPIMELSTACGGLMVWYFGGRAVLQGSPDLTLGKLMAYISYLMMFYGPVRMLTHFSDTMNRALTSMQRLFEVTDADQEVYEAPDAQPLKDPKGRFDFEDVHFGYVKDRPVLKGVELHIQPGEMIGLVGRSGAGKTTMTNLICRFYDVDEGSIKLDGVDLRKIRLRDLRRHIGIVPQEPFLFNGTIAQNIAYGRPGATREEIVAAAVAANAHGFIVRLPDGYDTRAGERGARLSGGEKQRVAIARAILHDPRVLILDEATSSVDTETEELIQQALRRLVKGRTTFAIAHRLSTLRNADRLLVIDDGKVAEIGTHDELMEKKGTYARLVEMQSRLSAITAVDG